MPRRVSISLMSGKWCAQSVAANKEDEVNEYVRMPDVAPSKGETPRFRASPCCEYKAQCQKCLMFGHWEAVPQFSLDTAGRSIFRTTWFPERQRFVGYSEGHDGSIKTQPLTKRKLMNQIARHPRRNLN